MMRVILLAALLALCVAPISCQVLSAINVVSFSYTGAMQTYAIPSNVQRIGVLAVGASGGLNYGLLQNGAFTTCGRGMGVYGEFDVTPGLVLNIIVGGKGKDNDNRGNIANGGAGGGGGSFVYDPRSLSMPYIAAGGGGGSCLTNNGLPFYLGKDATATTQGNSSWTGDVGPTNGASGNYGAKGWLAVRSDPSPGTGSSYGGDGGWGGGGSGSSHIAGAGGGYSAGATGSVDWKFGGGGGGSYSAGEKSTFEIGPHYSHGSVRITLLSITCINGTANAARTACVCDSGFYGITCNTSVACTATQVSRTNTTSFPTIDATEYRGNTLYMTLSGPYVRSRRYTSLTFIGATSPICSLYGTNTSVLASVWNKTVSGCRDALKLVLPWSSHTDCGFVSYDIGDSNVNAFKGQALLEIQESLGEFAGQLNLFRKTAEVYSIYVSFPKTITVTLTQVNVTSTTPIDIGVSGEQYSASTGLLTLEFTSVVLFSYMMLPNNFTVTVPSTTQVVGNVVIDNVRCTALSGSVCVQKITMQLSLVNAATCTFDGAYHMSSVLSSCRAGANCPTSPVDVDFYLMSGSVCTRVDLNPVVTGTLRAYTTSNTDNGPIATSFTIGMQTFFGLTINSAEANTATMNFIDIYFNDNVGGQTIYMLRNRTNVAAGNATSLTVLNAQRTFSLYLLGNVFQQSIGSATTFTISTKVELTFAGNKKRVVDVNFPVDNKRALGGGDEGDSSELVASTRIRFSSRAVKGEGDGQAGSKKPVNATPTNTTDKQQVDLSTYCLVLVISGLVTAVVMLHRRLAVVEAKLMNTLSTAV